MTDSATELYRLARLNPEAAYRRFRRMVPEVWAEVRRELAAAHASPATPPIDKAIILAMLGACHQRLQRVDVNSQAAHSKPEKETNQ